MLLKPVVNPVLQEFPALPVIPVVPIYAVVLALVVQVVPLRVLVVPRDPVMPGETGGVQGKGIFLQNSGGMGVRHASCNPKISDFPHPISDPFSRECTKLYSILDPESSIYTQF